MGKFDGKQIRGLVGNLVFRKGKDCTIIQTTPTVVKQSKDTKRSSKVFGQGSILACAIRIGIGQVTTSFYDGNMINRLNRPVREVLMKCFDKETETYTFEKDSFSRLAGVEFNIHSPLINNLWVVPQTVLEGNILKVSLPEMQLPKDLTFPVNANVCDVLVEVTTISIHDNYQRDLPEQRLEIHSAQASVPAHEFVFEVPDGCLCVAGIGLSYYQLSGGIKTVYNNKAFNPAAICGALITSGTFVPPVPVRTAHGFRVDNTHRIQNLDLPAL